MFKYSLEKRIKVIMYIADDNHSAHNATKFFGINKGQILNWDNPSSNQRDS